MLLKKLQEKLADSFWPIIGFLSFCAVVAFTVYCCKEQSNQEEFVAKLPQINSRAELDKALQEQPALYVVMKAPISGQAANDPFHILANPQVAVYYRHEAYQEHEEYDSDDDDYGTTSYSWVKVRGSLLHKSKQTYIYDNVPLDIVPCQISNWEAVRDLKELSADFQEADRKIDFASGNFFYPQGRGNYEDNERYAIYVVKQKAPVSFFAQIGQGQVKVCAVGKDRQLLFTAEDKPAVIVNGEKKDLAYGLYESCIGWLIGVWAAFISAVAMYKILK